MTGIQHPDAPNSAKTKQSVAEKSAAYRAEHPTDSQGQPINPKIDPPKYDGRGRRVN